MVKNKNIVVVGAGSGIGAGLVERLLVDNRVFGYYRTPVKMEEHEHLTLFGLDVISGILDPDKLPEVIDGVVYCPGTINLKPFRRLTEEDFINDFRVNVTGAVKVLQQVYPKLRKSAAASVILFSSVAAGLGMNFHSSIAASKGAVEGLVRSLAAEFAPKIRVNGIAPSLTDTPLASGLLSTAAKRESSSLIHPLKRIGTVNDQVNAALFLLSEESSWISGQILHVDGGLSSIKS